MIPNSYFTCKLKSTLCAWVSFTSINDAVTSKPATINADPYGSGWLVRITPGSWDTESTGLVTGAAAAAAFEAKMNADGFAGCQ